MRLQLFTLCNDASLRRVQQKVQQQQHMYKIYAQASQQQWLVAPAMVGHMQSIYTKKDQKGQGEQHDSTAIFSQWKMGKFIPSSTANNCQPAVGALVNTTPAG